MVFMFNNYIFAFHRKTFCKNNKGKKGIEGHLQRLIYQDQSLLVTVEKYTCTKHLIYAQTCNR